MFPISSAMFLALQVTTVLWLMPLLSRSISAYELQDTIHTLKDENLHLQNRLENLTQALRDLKHLLIEHSKIPAGEFFHIWREWSQHGISAETHRVLEKVLCLSQPHGAVQSISNTPGFLLISSFISMIFLLQC